MENLGRNPCRPKSVDGYHSTSIAATLLMFAIVLSHSIAKALDLSKHTSNDIDTMGVSRRHAIAITVGLGPLITTRQHAKATTNHLKVVTDPKTYSALAYAPPNNSNNNAPPPPLIVVLHGAGRNDQSIFKDLADPAGEHAGLIPSLIAASSSETAAPSNLLDNFCVIAPYSYGKSSFYNDSRGQLLDFMDWAIENQNTNKLPIRFDPTRIVLFGFSDGATVAVELLTSRRIAFKAGVICSYGYTGKSLPPQALERIANIPIWVFHSQDDVIFDVQNSDRLVRQLRSVNGEEDENHNNLQYSTDRLIQYSRYSEDPEHLPARVRGHSMGITASKSPQVYDWLLEKLQTGAVPSTGSKS